MTPINIKALVNRVGTVRLTVMTTVLSVALSVLIGVLISWVFDFELTRSSWLLSIITPLLVAPAASYFPFKLLTIISSLEAEMRALATYDNLTKTLTRRAFIEHAEQHLKWAYRYGQGFAVLMIDIDHFKKVNDTYGHAGGDQVLMSFGRLLQTAKRESDMVGRLGGEEFALLLPNTDLSAALGFSEKLLQAIRNDVVSFDGVTIHYTASVGVEEFLPDTTQRIDRLLEHADKALYIAKNTGRNRAQAYHDVAPADPA